MKKTNYFLQIFFIIFLCCISISFSEQDKKGNTLFQYAFLYKKSDGTIDVVNHKKRITDIKTGERIKIYIDPVTPAYIYLYHVSSEGTLSLLFPQKFFFFSDEYKTETACYLPSEERWYILKEPSGIEEFHLIVSKQRLFNLESLTKHFFEIKQIKQDEIKIADARQDILDEIKHLKKKGNILGRKSEKPVPIAGVIRSLDEEQLSCYQITFTDIYAKTIRIRH